MIRGTDLATNSSRSSFWLPPVPGAHELPTNPKSDSHEDPRSNARHQAGNTGTGPASTATQLDSEGAAA